ncbi:endonuclease/exonuclease/phosphatase family protein [Citricoccus sp. SGAir0253]|uniref:endonuclease/exonuclease/phosphatase family protein n=1 Tax=Citricoccus sp. SGAir0253 TaxID=2567881 RepID=UPI0010CD02C0|nr:endonuclease/exonuclease/phosphatase family protein [Citricoccus sp. SGAir0253]QCU79377.1 endonuclease/exonuclease/phosphatase family protein [Citricoccus sp. SGAir0253]
MTTEALIGPVGPPGLHLMTYNIRRRLPTAGHRSPDGWPRRRELLRRLVAAEAPAVLCLQEALPDQVDWVLACLGPGHRPVGRGRRAGGGGEGTPVLYDDHRLRLTDWCQQALSDTPDLPGSRGWGALIPRIVVRATFRDLATGARFRVLNTHLDALSARARLQSARMLRRLVEADPVPTVLAGDANAVPRSRPYRELTAGGLLRDAWTAADRRVTKEWGTFSGYGPPRRGRRIDWLMVGPGIDVRTVGINAARYDGAAPSDHEPVQAVLEIAR